jgi:hypothetical protein
MRRKILMGVLALALPAGSIALFSSTATAKGSSSNPVTCVGFGGTITFAGPITNEGTLTTSKTAPNTGVTTSAFTCSGGTAPNTGGSGSTPALSIKGGKNSKNSSYNKKTCSSSPSPTVCDKYVSGTWGAFINSGGSLKKDLKTIPITIGGSAGTFKVKSGQEIPSCGGGPEVGFVLGGQVKGGNYQTKSGSITVCLGADTRFDGSHGTFATDLSTDNGGGVVSASIDPTYGNATL